MYKYAYIFEIPAPDHQPGWSDWYNHKTVEQALEAVGAIFKGLRVYDTTTSTPETSDFYAFVPDLYSLTHYKIVADWGQGWGYDTVSSSRVLVLFRNGPSSSLPPASTVMGNQAPAPAPQVTPFPRVVALSAENPVVTIAVEGAPGDSVLEYSTNSDGSPKQTVRAVFSRYTMEYRTTYRYLQNPT